MDFNNVLTDGQGEYVVDQYGSKHRRQGTNSWSLAEVDMTQAHKDALAAQTQADADALQAQKDSAIEAAVRIKNLLGITTPQTKQLIKDMFETVQYLDEIG